MSRVYLDSNLFIYLLEDAGPRGERARPISFPGSQIVAIFY